MLGPTLRLAAMLGGEPNVQWSAPPPCPSASEVLGRIAALLAEGSSDHGSDVALELVVTATPDGFSLRASAEYQTGERSERLIAGPTCAEVTEAAILVAALAIDPELEASAPPPSVDPPGQDLVPAPTSPPAAPVVPPSPPPAPPDPPVPARTRSEGPKVVPTASPPIVPIVLGDLGLGFGRLAEPWPMPYLRFGAGFDRGRLRVLGRLSGFGPSFGTVEESEQGGSMGLGAIGVAVCAMSRGRWRAVACAATDVGFVAGRGRNTEETATQWSPSWGLEAELGVEFRIRPTLALALRAHGGGQPVTPDFAVEGGGRVCCASWAAGLGLGIVGSFEREGERTR